MNYWFVTGTDTDVGKTYITSLIMQALHHHQQTSIGYKPISAGCQSTVDGLRNEDALILQAHGAIDVPYEQVNPVAFEPPIAPHIAAAAVSHRLSIEPLVKGLEVLSRYPVQHVLSEGAGGWRLPLGNGQFLSELATAAQMQVILVVELKLGCLNHAVLTAEAIQNDGLTIVGWVANAKNTDMLVQQENITALTELMPAPLMGIIPHNDGSIQRPWKAVDISPLLSLAD